VVSGFSVWQTLPLSPPHADLSPYRAQSVHGGNPALLSPEILRNSGRLQGCAEANAGETWSQYRVRALRRAYEQFDLDTGQLRQDFDDFLQRHNSWLEDYALYQALRARFPDLPWWHWPTELKDRHPEALSSAKRSLTAEIDFHRFLQFTFRQQWAALKNYANECGVLMFGDIPLFVARDSADVWANRKCFRLDRNGNPRVLTGVPPDYFSAEGQLWGNPHYDWAHMAADGYDWWIERLRNQLELYDLVRIDHFRGLQAAWEVEPGEKTAVNGCWREAPGQAVLEALRRAAGELPLVAEDLGLITEEVRDLRDAFNLPGMAILQFAFHGDADNPYLPHNQTRNSVVYTGTHDNATTVGWWRSVDEHTRRKVLSYFSCTPHEVPDVLCRAALASVAQLAMLPMQDLLGLSAEHRMNVPGTAKGNWRWRFDWSQIPGGLSTRYSHLVATYGRYISN
jgi:4-alpha-glucanotransferase